jgi:DNA-binding FadR family transcriptional regulator
MSGDEATATRPERAARRIADLVRAAEPGTRLGTKAELREACGVSVGTFNEALRLAQARGLIAVRPGPGGGLFAAEQSPLVRLGNAVLTLDSDETAVVDAIRIRDALDPLVIADAARHSSPADVDGYRTQLAAMSAARDQVEPVAFMAANWRLHELIAAVNPSPVLRAIYTALLDVIRSHAIGVGVATDQAPDEVLAARLRVHADLVDAIVDGDLDRLRRAIAEHSVEHARDHQPSAAERN